MLTAAITQRREAQPLKFVLYTHAPSGRGTRTRNSSPVFSSVFHVRVVVPKSAKAATCSHTPGIYEMPLFNHDENLHVFSPCEFAERRPYRRFECAAYKRKYCNQARIMGLRRGLTQIYKSSPSSSEQCPHFERSFIL